MFNLYKTPWIIKRLFPSLVWQIPGDLPTVYLTFDDGPTPGVTDKILSLLNEKNVKATFFCCGKNVELFPVLYKRILSERHALGNHGYNHLNGLKTSTKKYLDDVHKTSKVITSTLFRPPYGLMKPSQLKALNKKYIIVMWDVMSYDFSLKMSVTAVKGKLIKHVKNGSIIVFHDNEKASEKLMKILPWFIDYFGSKGFQYKVISF